MAVKVMGPDAISQRKHVCIRQSRSKSGTLWNASADSGSRTLKKSKPESDKQDLLCCDL